MGCLGLGAHIRDVEAASEYELLKASRGEMKTQMEECETMIEKPGEMRGGTDAHPLVLSGKMTASYSK